LSTTLNRKIDKTLNIRDPRTGASRITSLFAAAASATAVIDSKFRFHF